MEFDWNIVKKITLWQYEELLKKLNAVLAYPVLRKAYNHTMPQAIDYARRLFPDKNIAAGEFPADIIATFESLQSAGVSDCADLFKKVSTREACAAFVAQNNVQFDALIGVLGYLLRWHFPFFTASRELFDHDNLQEMDCYQVLKQHKLMNSFDILERGQNPEQRRKLAEQTGLPLSFVTSLVHRADIARLPWVRRKTLIPVCGAGYDTLAKIAAAHIPQMEAGLEAFYQRTQGKSWEDFKSVIVLRLLVIDAQALPPIIINAD